MKKRFDAYQAITDDLVAKIEADPGVWKKSWVALANALPTRFSGDLYKGVNLFLLGMQGRGQPIWMTYRQAQEVGGQVRGGEPGTKVVFFKPLKIADKETGEDKTIPMVKAYTVFNVDQIDGLPEKYLRKEETRHTEPPIDEIEAYVKYVGGEVRHGGDRAFFSPGQDFVQMPAFKTFNTAVDYYATLGHELVHWTGHKSRLDRNLRTVHGSDDYAFEELVAEIGAAFLLARWGIVAEDRDDHAQYLAAWLERMKGDKKFIFQAAAAAQKAVEYLDDLQPTEAAQAA